MSAPLPIGLVRADPATPGLGRRRRGRGWSYLDEHGEPIIDPDLIARVKALVIPPAWQDVWISPDEYGHIQAVGTDAAGRRQYRYHDEWTQARGREKHDRVLKLGRKLHRVRAEIVSRLAEPGLSRDRVLAAGVRMLDVGVFRAGGEEYAPDDDDDDGSFGLATLRREHVQLRRGTVRFHYPAKGGIERNLIMVDPVLHKVINSLLRRRGGGEDLLVYRLGRDWHDVTSADLNAAVKELAGPPFTCKDLRTWNATVLAAVSLASVAAQEMPTSKRGLAQAVTAAVTQVSEHLGNTPTVARASYIDPRVIDSFTEGRTVWPTLRRLPGAPDLADDATRATVERAVVRLISS